MPFPARTVSPVRFASRNLALLAITAAAMSPFLACHSAQAADSPRAISPTIEIEVEDREADKSSRTARFSLTMLEGHAQIATRDGQTKYDVEAHTTGSNDPHFRVTLKRADGNGGLDISSSIPLRAGPRVLLAKLDRASGQLTSVVAQVR